MNNKKTYTTPEMDIVRIAQASMIATSTPTLTVTGGGSETASEENSITQTGVTNSVYEFNSNAFEGGLMDE
jgi:hypothetical protein